MLNPYYPDPTLHMRMPTKPTGSCTVAAGCTQLLPTTARDALGHHKVLTCAGMLLGESTPLFVQGDTIVYPARHLLPASMGSLTVTDLVTALSHVQSYGELLDAAYWHSSDLIGPGEHEEAARSARLLQAVLDAALNGSPSWSSEEEADESGSDDSSDGDGNEAEQEVARPGTPEGDAGTESEGSSMPELVYYASDPERWELHSGSSTDAEPDWPPMHPPLGAPARTPCHSAPTDAHCALVPADTTDCAATGTQQVEPVAVCALYCDWDGLQLGEDEGSSQGEDALPQELSARAWAALDPTDGWGVL